MCGIAGYHVSPDWARSYITADAQAKILEEAMLHNQHRGEDATGYFNIDLEGVTSHWKEIGNAASHFIENTIPVPPVSTILGTHTRAATQGPPEANWNNHPVQWDNVLAIHNGHISNDWGILSAYGLDDIKSYPSVDSFAIPVLLSDTKGPYDLDNIAIQLNELMGGFAIHAIWDDNPQASLLAKGNTSPLIVARHKAGAVVYGSEKESVASMIRSMTLNEQHMSFTADDGWEWFSLKANNFLLIDGGQIASWGTFASPTPTYGRNELFSVKRWLPRKKHRNKRTAIYESDWNTDYAIKAIDEPSMLNSKKGKVVAIQGDVSSGKDQDQYPVATDSNQFAALGEADYVVKSPDGYYHAFYGDIEIVINDSRHIKDVFNHDLFKNSQRWEKVNKPGADVEDNDGPIRNLNLDWDMFSDAETTHVATPTVDSLSTYRYARKAKEVSSYPKVSQIAPKQSSVTSMADGELEYVNSLKWSQPPFMLDKHDIKTGIIAHQTSKELFFPVNRDCPIHDIPLHEHMRPYDCDYVLYGAAYTLSAFYELDMFPRLNPSWKIETEESINTCGNHDWVPDEHIIVYWQDIRFPITTAESCWHCKSYRRLKLLPSFLTHINHTDRVDYFVS